MACRWGAHHELGIPLLLLREQLLAPLLCDRPDLKPQLLLLLGQRTLRLRALLPQRRQPRAQRGRLRLAARVGAVDFLLLLPLAHGRGYALAVGAGAGALQQELPDVLQVAARRGGDAFWRLILVAQLPQECDDARGEVHGSRFHPLNSRTQSVVPLSLSPPSCGVSASVDDLATRRAQQKLCNAAKPAVQGRGPADFEMGGAGLGPSGGAGLLAQ
jgi:hypothetical protein